MYIYILSYIYIYILLYIIYILIYYIYIYIQYNLQLSSCLHILQVASDNTKSRLHGHQRLSKHAGTFGGRFSTFNFYGSREAVCLHGFDVKVAGRPCVI